ncbi:MAG: hypothetical protein A2W52_00425 [Candidatus Taylorbacteria bacterium RIFCSPHIGHO2_02_49_25]|uniref:Uncharacterized protein n=1 Tax=Candidatus Taylorbacteria bacterium RIFCSPHIGHO2_02_49_25 TaxID=1802305 RepID=A0A1G2MJ78_9BACT|nr:MAG: hypothetical protein A2759_03745 [Candidatus Taylorbacteria bacterium RIFCSPHIGHO2_01_FULL_49_60]OHA23061.1 MAG: hypothetical protein A2W52_00425 [Candidatus Taylorbacteria bacterium RIFCSPHIGHO2_02_49_25]OHA35313.1 MAG: hypothetical protein A3B27_03535 [Candidatus Taylorbacteria bacterium RIFCSPLOWO2_01_FULL_50_130]OHA36397.1 MAG: hypothetical protein A2W65_02760 [Candidatus Taylorbacteria bacterium RIFCSPLOWO2_02_50_13]OHA41195.1 MAG: hypothetical protein A3H73_02975 [Candidatus Taylo
MNQTTRTKTIELATRPQELLMPRRAKLPESFLKAAGIIRDRKQRLDLERHARKMRSEWR